MADVGSSERKDSKTFDFEDNDAAHCLVATCYHQVAWNMTMMMMMMMTMMIYLLSSENDVTCHNVSKNAMK